MSPLSLAARYEGVILGTAVADALGLPTEGMSRERCRRWLGPTPLRHRFWRGRGLCSDDTEHTCLVAQALIASRGEPNVFRDHFARGLRRWLATLPPGIGWGTLRGIVRLWLGYPPSRSGVRSAGNGPAMRAAILGVHAADDPPRLRRLVAASTRLTHSDPRAEQAALVVALAAAEATRGVHRSGRELVDAIARQVDDPALVARLALVGDPAKSGEDLADELGLGRGVTGYAYDTVPVALHCWLRQPSDYAAVVGEVIRLGGDTDTTAAIAGALAGATVGGEGIPADWRNDICEYPRTVAWMRALASALVTGQAPAPLSLLALTVRNLGFMVLLCGLLGRRLLARLL